MTELVIELRERLFKQTDAITFDVLSERPAAEIPSDHEEAYGLGYLDALVDAKVYFRMAIIKILSEKQ